MRTFILINKEGYYVKVATYGKEAENFSYIPGDILFIYDAKLSSYGGLSLNIFMSSHIRKLNPNMQNEIVESLWKWWTTEWWNSRNKDKHLSVNSLIQQKRKN